MIQGVLRVVWMKFSNCCEAFSTLEFCCRTPITPGKILATVSVFDSGFMLGDGVWEGLRLYDGKLSFLEEHLDRLYSAALYLEIDIGGR